jgi:GAF domain-containing protein
VLARERLPVDYLELVLLDEAIDQNIVRAVTSYARTRERMLQALERISQAALESEDEEGFLSRLLEVLMGAAVSVEGVSILLREGGKFRLRGRDGGWAPGSSSPRASTSPWTTGITGLTASRRQPVAVRFASSHPLLRNERVRRLGLRAAYCVPMIHRGEVIGVAHMGSRTVFEFSESDLLLLPHHDCAGHGLRRPHAAGGARAGGPGRGPADPGGAAARGGAARAAHRGGGA